MISDKFSVEEEDIPTPQDLQTSPTQGKYPVDLQTSPTQGNNSVNQEGSMPARTKTSVPVRGTVKAGQDRTQL
jgi:hypothetical protein